MACICCSCNVDQNPYPDPYCREFSGPFQRQCDIHGSPGRMPPHTTAFPVSTQERLAGGSP